MISRDRWVVTLEPRYPREPKPIAPLMLRTANGDSLLDEHTRSRALVQTRKFTRNAGSLENSSLAPGGGLGTRGLVSSRVGTGFGGGARCWNRRCHFFGNSTWGGCRESLPQVLRAVLERAEWGPRNLASRSMRKLWFVSLSRLKLAPQRDAHIINNRSDCWMLSVRVAYKLRRRLRRVESAARARHVNGYLRLFCVLLKKMCKLRSLAAL